MRIRIHITVAQYTRSAFYAIVFTIVFAILAYFVRPYTDSVGHFFAVFWAGNNAAPIPPTPWRQIICVSPLCIFALCMIYFLWFAPEEPRRPVRDPSLTEFFAICSCWLLSKTTVRRTLITPQAIVHYQTDRTFVGIAFIEQQLTQILATNPNAELEPYEEHLEIKILNVQRPKALAAENSQVPATGFKLFDDVPVGKIVPPVTERISYHKTIHRDLNEDDGPAD